KRAESQPVAGMMTALAARYDVMTQDISSRPADSEPCMWGSATLVTLVSRTCMTVTIITENVIAQRRVGVIGGGAPGSATLTPLPYRPLVKLGPTAPNAIGRARCTGTLPPRG